MSQSTYFDEFQQAVSSERLRPYLNRSTGVGQAEAFALYLWNASLCEGLYPTLQGIEISLRNKIHQAASNAFGDDYWFRTRLIEREREMVLRLETGLPPHTGLPAPGRYISECSFGFWVGLFRGDYEQILWTQLLPAVSVVTCARPLRPSSKGREGPASY